MSVYFQTVAGVLLTIILALVVGRQNKDVSLLLVLAVCAMVLVLAGQYLEPVINFLNSLQSLISLDGEWISVMLKAVGIGLTAQIASLLCADSGNGALARAVEILAVGAILWLSLPLMTALMELIQKVLGEL